VEYLPEPRRLRGVGPEKVESVWQLPLAKHTDHAVILHAKGNFFRTWELQLPRKVQAEWALAPEESFRLVAMLSLRRLLGETPFRDRLVNKTAHA
jgi:hypothetical protein